MRRSILLVIGSVMVTLGAFIALRPLWAGPAPLTSSRWLDVAFAAFFLIRGVMTLRTALRTPRTASAPPPGGDAR
ncbi:MAG TPA: hypothetical protein VFS08_18645 [Gemmatimonadaceae bacterium]|nr:hypothetical protein [Gemmatimonadaceae bacterium]